MTGYTKRLMAAYASGLIVPGSVSHVAVEHDPGCPALRGRECACTPEITVTTGNAVITVDEAGNAHVERNA